MLVNATLEGEQGMDREAVLYNFYLALKSKQATKENEEHSFRIIFGRFVQDLR